MVELIVTIVIGLALCVIGIINTTGNIRSIHWYHRQRVTAENVKAFGKLVGIGTVIIGAALIVFGVLTFVYQQTGIFAAMVVAFSVLIVSIVVGLGLSFYAMIKYNKGIF